MAIGCKWPFAMHTIWRLAQATGGWHPLGEGGGHTRHALARGDSTGLLVLS